MNPVFEPRTRVVPWDEFWIKWCAAHTLRDLEDHVENHWNLYNILKPRDLSCIYCGLEYWARHLSYQDEGVNTYLNLDGIVENERRRELERADALQLVQSAGNQEGKSLSKGDDSQEAD